MRIVEQGELSESYGGRFTGRVELEMLQPAEADDRPDVARVHFHEGAVTNWHSHPGGQHLYLWRAGTRRHARRRARDRPGDYVVAPAGRAPLPRRRARRRRRLARDHLGCDGLGGRARAAHDAASRHGRRGSRVRRPARRARPRRRGPLGARARGQGPARRADVDAAVRGHGPAGRDRRLVVRARARRGAIRARALRARDSHLRSPVLGALAHRRRAARRPAGAVR